MSPSSLAALLPSALLSKCRKRLLGSHPALICLAVLLAGSSAWCRDCVDYPSYAHVAARLQIPQFNGVYGGIAVDGVYAYAVGGPSQGPGIQVIDVSVPETPLVVGSLDTPGVPTDIVLFGSFALVADGASGVHVIDISNRSSPIIVGTVDTPGRAVGIALQDGHAYVADVEGGLQVIDVSNPLSPALVGSLATPYIMAVAVAGNHAYVSVFLDGLSVVDISNPSFPTLAASKVVPAYGGLTVAGDRVFVLGGRPTLPNFTGLWILGIANPAAPTLLGMLEIGSSHLDNEIVVAGSMAFVADGILQMVDVSQPAAARVVGRVVLDYAPSGLAQAGQFAYVPGWSGLTVIDLAVPMSPAALGAVDTPGQAHDIALSGTSLACIADGSAGLQIVDFSDPAAPVLVGGIDTPGSARAVDVEGGQAFVADGEAGVQIVDISTPSLPAIVGSIDLPAAVEWVAVEGERVYVLGGSTLRIIDVSIPSAPVELGSVGGLPGSGPIEITGKIAYVYGHMFSEHFGLRVIDVSDPTSPAIVRLLDLNSASVAGIAIRGTHAYIAEFEGIFHALDISDPSNPTLLGRCASPGAVAVAVDDTHAYVKLWSGWGLNVMDVAAPAAPSLIGTASGPGELVGRGVEVSGNIVLVAAGEAGFVTYPAQCSNATDVDPFANGLGHGSLFARPNPARSETSLIYELTRGEPVRMQVFDLAGRRVRDLVSGFVPNGVHVTAWDGRDDRGRLVASGVYFVRLARTQGVSIARVTWLR